MLLSLTSAVNITASWAQLALLIAPDRAYKKGTKPRITYMVFLNKLNVGLFLQFSLITNLFRNNKTLALQKASCLLNFSSSVQGIPCSHCCLTSGWHTSQSVPAAVWEQLSDFPAVSSRSYCQSSISIPCKGHETAERYSLESLGWCHVHPYCRSVWCPFAAPPDPCKDQFYSFPFQILLKSSSFLNTPFLLLQ